jgi:L-ribulose-5-phosphate 3-epimerase
MSDSEPTKMSRRTLLVGAAMSGAFRALGEDTVQATDSAPAKLKICVFSKHFQWTSVAEAAAIASDIGFDGVDLTVRAGGHVLPERVEVDLPAAVEAVRRAGLTVPMISTEITSVQTPHAEAMLKTASQLGIRQYRWHRRKAQ